MFFFSSKRASSLLLLIRFNLPVVFAGDDVRSQYEAFPYPPRYNAFLPRAKTDDRLVGVNHYIYGGELFTERQASGVPLRILIAGGGTGRETAFWAMDLERHNLKGSVTHLDFSLQSIRIARELISVVGLEHRVTFTHSTIETFAEKHLAEGLPPYDIIGCTGVLHHLDDPDLGLRLLQQILAPDGGVDVSVYGKHGRSGIYEIQEALRYALPANEVLTDGERVQELRGLLFETRLPQTNTCSNNQHCIPNSLHSDAEVLDRFLHRQDLAYSVTEFAKYVSDANLRIVSLLPEATYEPDYTVFTTPELRRSYMARRLRNRDRLQQFHFTELVTSRPNMHYAWLAQLDDHGKSRSAPDRQRYRREDKTWRQVMVPVQRSSKFSGASEEWLSLWERIAASRSNNSFPLLVNWPGKSNATVPMPILSFAFDRAVAHGNLTVEQIIQDVVSSAAGWSSSLPVSVVPLGYEEVVALFFEWLDKSEAMYDVFCVHTPYNGVLGLHA